MTVVSYSGVPWYTTQEGVPKWFDAEWPLSGHREQGFDQLDPTSMDELMDQEPSIKVDFGNAQIAARFTGFTHDSSTWGAFCRQQVLIYFKKEWLLLFAPAQEKAIRKGMPEIDEFSDLGDSAHPLYLQLNSKSAEVYIETVCIALSPNGSQVLDEIRDMRLPKLKRVLRNLGELLIAWGVPNSSSWPQLTSEFPDFDALRPYLIDRGVLFSGGTHPAHSPTDSATIMLAKKWLELPRDKGGPANNKQSTFVATIAKENRGISPSELAKVMTDWDEAEPCAKSAAKRLNERLEKTNQQWRVDPSNAGRCRIVEASSLAAKSAKRKA